MEIELNSFNGIDSFHPAEWVSFKERGEKKRAANEKLWIELENSKFYLAHDKRWNIIYIFFSYRYWWLQWEMGKNALVIDAKSGI